MLILFKQRIYRIKRIRWLRKLFLFAFFAEEAFLLIAGRCRAAHQRIEFKQSFTLFGIELGRNIDNDSDELVSPRLTADILNTLTLESEYRTGLRALGDIIFNLAVQRRNHERITQCCLNEVDMDLAPNVKAVTLKERMRSYVDNYMKIACRATVDTLIALTADIENLTVINSCRNIHLKRTLFCDATSATALRTRSFDYSALAAAL